MENNRHLSLSFYSFDRPKKEDALVCFLTKDLARLNPVDFVGFSRVSGILSSKEDERNEIPSRESVNL